MRLCSLLASAALVAGSGNSVNASDLFAAAEKKHPNAVKAHAVTRLSRGILNARRVHVPPEQIDGVGQWLGDRVARLAELASRAAGENTWRQRRVHEARTQLVRLRDRPTKTWLPEIKRLQRRAQERGDYLLADLLLACRWQAQKDYLNDHPEAGYPSRTADAERLAENWLEKFAGPVTAFLPLDLPPLPRASLRMPSEVAKVVRANTPRKAYAILENRAAILGASLNLYQQQLAADIGRYLAPYREKVVLPWTRRRLAAFREDAYRYRFALERYVQRREPGLKSANRHNVAASLAVISDQLAGLVHGELLMRLPPMRVDIYRQSTRAMHKKTRRSARATLPIDVTPRTMRHEFGHHLEKLSGLKLPAVGLALLVRHGAGEPATTHVMKSSDDNGTARRTADCFEGDFPAGRYSAKASCTWTEIWSTFIAATSPKAFEGLFYASPDYTLRLLSTLQRGPFF